MRGLEPPPKQDTPTRVVARISVLVVLLLLFGVTIWAAVTNQRIPLVEDRPLDSFVLPDSEFSEGILYHLVDRGSSDTPVFLFHDAEVSGSVMFESLVAALDGQVRTVAVDLPGFGFTTRLPARGNFHTVGNMGERLAAVVEARSDGPAVLVGVGLGGRVAAEIAATRPELVEGLVIVDADFYGGGSWVNTLEKIPFIGRAVTFAFEVSGPLSDEAQAPYCDDGGWCPTPEQVATRALVTEVAGTTYSLYAFRNTPEAANVPALFDQITAPSVFVWSERGPVSEGSVDRLLDELPGTTLETFDVFQAVQERSEEVAALVLDLVN